MFIFIEQFDQSIKPQFLHLIKNSLLNEIFPILNKKSVRRGVLALEKRRKGNGREKFCVELKKGFLKFILKGKRFVQRR